MKHLFPFNSVKHKHNLKRTQKLYVNKSSTQRFEKSPIIYMLKLLNRDHNRKKRVKVRMTNITIRITRVQF